MVVEGNTLAARGGDSWQRQLPKIALWLIGVMCAAPFLVNRHYLPIPTFFNELAAAVLGLAAATLLLRQSDWQAWNFPVIGLLPFGLVILLMLQVASGVVSFPQQNLLAALYLLWACCLIMLGAVLRRELGIERVVAVMSGFILTAAVLNALIVLQQIFQISTPVADWLMPATSSNYYGNLGQRNHLADLMAMGLASLLYLRAMRKLNLASTLILVFLLLFVMSLIGSRSTWLYLGAMAVMMLWARSKGADRSVIVTAWSLLPAFAVMQLVVSLPWVANYGTVVTSTERLFHEVSGISLRLQMWQQAWSMFLHSPWMGIGFGRFSWATFEMAATWPGLVDPEPLENAHNLLMILLAEMGIPAALLLVVLLGAWAWRVAQCGYSRERWWLMAMVAILGIHSMLEYPLWYLYFLGIAAVLAGLGETTFLQPKIRFGRGLLLVALVLGWVSLVNMMQSYLHLEAWFALANKGGAEQKAVQQAKPVMAEMSRESLLSPYVILAVAVGLTPDRTHLQEQLQVCDVAQRFSPVRQVVFKYALLLAMAGKHAQAGQQLRMAMAAYPGEVPGFNQELRKLVLQDSAALQPLLEMSETQIRGSLRGADR